MSPPEQARSPSQLERVLVLVKGSRDGNLTRSMLARVGIEVHLCADVADLSAQIEQGAGAALLVEEVLTSEGIERLSTVLRRQPAWSDFPIVVFSAVGNDLRPASEALALLGNVTFLDRPVRVRSMLASVHAAIRSRRRQYEARHAIESRDAFLAMLGHELRNPLEAISLALAVEHRRMPDRQMSRERSIVERQSKHLARLVDDLLDVARITHGKVVLKREKMNIVDVVRSAFETLEPRARAEGLSCTLQTREPGIWIDGDRQRLEQVVVNLVTNAIKYTPRGGTVSIDVGSDDGMALVSVTDTGIGLARDMLNRIFDAFAQAHRSLDRAEGGIGLGLALVRSIVQLHGGTVEARSEGLGLGTTFLVRLRRLSDSSLAEPRSTRAIEDRAIAKRVVVVEDSPDIRDLLVELLQHGGHEVTCANDGPTGLETILTTIPEIAFVDLGLPGFDGLEVARRARASGSRARLVALTGYGQAEDKQRALEAGFDDHLTKPVIDADIERALLRAEGAEFRAGARAPGQLGPTGP